MCAPAWLRPCPCYTPPDTALAPLGWRAWRGGLYHALGPAVSLIAHSWIWRKHGTPLQTRYTHGTQLFAEGILKIESLYEFMMSPNVCSNRLFKIFNKVGFLYHLVN